MTEVREFVGHSVQQSDAASTQIEQIRSIVAQNTGQMGEMAGVLQQQSQAVSEIASGVNSIAGHVKTAAEYANQVITVVGASEKLITEQFTEFERSYGRSVCQKCWLGSIP